MLDDKVIEQLKRFIDRIEARFDHIELMMKHHQEMDNERHKFLSETIAELKAEVADHGARLRPVSDAATQFKVLAGLATGGYLLGVCIPQGEVVGAGDVGDLEVRSAHHAN